MWAGIKVLLVDEHDVRREATKYVLEKERYQVTGVNNCAEARTSFWQDFDLLIIDFDLHQRNEGRGWRRRGVICVRRLLFSCLALHAEVTLIRRWRQLREDFLSRGYCLWLRS